MVAGEPGRRLKAWSGGSPEGMKGRGRVYRAGEGCLTWSLFDLTELTSDDTNNVESAIIFAGPSQLN